MADDLNETAKLLGLRVADPKSMAAKENPQPVDPNADIIKTLGLRPSKPRLEPRAPVFENRGPQQSWLEGMGDQMVLGVPVVGPALQHATAAINAIPKGKSSKGYVDRYEEELAKSREQAETFSLANPKSSTAANLMGAAAGTVPIMMTGPGAAVFGGGAGPVGGRVLIGSTTGGIIGGADAALRGDNVVGGAATGVATGAGGPLVGEAARAVSRHFANMLAPRTGPLAQQPTSNLNLLTGALEGETPASLAVAKNKMGPAGMFADINTATTDLAGGLADMPGPHKGPLRQAYITRALGQRDRMETAIDDAMGPRIDMVKLSQHIAEDQKAAANPLYKQWESMAVQPTEELKALVPRLRKAGAFNRAMELADITGDPINRKFFTGGPIKDYPTTQTWNYIKMGLDSKIENAYASGDKTKARALLGLKHEMLAEIEKTNAGKVWKQARREWATRAEWQENMDAGRDTFLGGRSAITADELKEELKGLSQPELMARIHGARAAVAQAMGESLRGDGTTRAKLLAPNNQEKLRLLIGDKRADKLIKSLESEEYLMEKHADVIGNKHTGASASSRSERRDALKLQATPEWGFDLQKPATYLPPSWRENLRPGNVISAYRADKHQKGLNQLADVLMTPQAQMDDLVMALRNEGARRAAAEARGQKIGNAMSGAIVGPIAPTVRREYGR